MSTEGNILFANYLGGHNMGIFGDKDHKKVDMFFLELQLGLFTSD